MNNVAVELCLDEPDLLSSRQTLIQRARAKVNSTYHFKKGKSRSVQAQSNPQPPKRPKTSETLRSKHIGDLKEDLKDLCDQLVFKEKRREQATMSRNYKVCDQLTEEMSVIKKKKRTCEQELHLWERKQQQANWYKQKGKGRSRGSASDSYFSSSSQCSTSSSYPSRHTTPSRVASSRESFSPASPINHISEPFSPTSLILRSPTSPTSLSAPPETVLSPPLTVDLTETHTGMPLVTSPTSSSAPIPPETDFSPPETVDLTETHTAMELVTSPTSSPAPIPPEIELSPSGQMSDTRGLPHF